jgi:peptide/nickel transport system ATP-binding protein
MTISAIPFIADGTMPILEAAGVRKIFSVNSGVVFGRTNTVKAVEAANLALYPGKVLALVGESGSGKTTLARVLAGMYPATEGIIRFQGNPIDLRHRVSKDYYRHVQLIFQDPFSSLNPLHTVRYHLARPLRIFGYARNAQETHQQIIELLERVNLTPAEQFIEKFPHELSGGQRQRIAIARALAVRPKVLLADEPVSMLDVSIRLDVLNLLARLKDEEHLALLYITHDIASARYFSDAIMVMYAGQSVEGGPTEDVIRAPSHPYTRLLLSAAPDPMRMLALKQAQAAANGSGNGHADLLNVVDIPERGEPPSLINPPSGCRFHPRCPLATTICREQFPARTELGKGHWVNCHHYDEREANAWSVPAHGAGG